MNLWAEIKRWLHILTSAEWVMVFLTFVIAATGVVGILLVIQGGKDSKRIADAAEKQACAAKSFAKSADGIKTKIGLAEADFSRLASNSEQSLKATQETMRLEQRAWISINLSATVKVGEPVEVVADLQNTGKTPAINIHGFVVFDPVYKGQKPNFDYSKDKAIKVGVLQPNAPDNVKMFGSRDKSTGAPVPLKKEDLPKIIDGTVVLYTHGILHYNDVFGIAHWVEFCGFVNPQTNGVSVCADSRRNNIDQNPN